ncbi:hypothetical protein GMRT_10887 [Giardia muris]|uniref:Uncharacterized protein n=1 Tax=Giardia muris TaxID=5742 RepID=A0A4Z1SUI0_GIAMU|nr:hypothetical protein GMRT_10887 [Giardia muris]|eukprot:TNJ28625.1 hypothetical protein GMRT_10887 [Giardia muris]
MAAERIQSDLNFLGQQLDRVVGTLSKLLQQDHSDAVYQELRCELVEELLELQDNINSMRDPDAKTSSRDFADFAKYGASFIFSEDVLARIDDQYNGNPEALFQYLKTEAEKIRTVQLQTLARVAALQHMRGLINRSIRGSLMHSRLLLRCYLATEAMEDVLPMAIILAIPHRKLLTILRASLASQSVDLSEDGVLSIIQRLVEAPKETLEAQQKKNSSLLFLSSSRSTDDPDPRVPLLHLILFCYLGQKYPDVFEFSRRIVFEIGHISFLPMTLPIPDMTDMTLDEKCRGNLCMNRENGHTCLEYEASYQAEALRIPLITLYPPILDSVRHYIESLCSPTDILTLLGSFLRPDVDLPVPDCFTGQGFLCLPLGCNSTTLEETHIWLRDGLARRGYDVHDGASERVQEMVESMPQRRQHTRLTYAACRIMAGILAAEFLLLDCQGVQDEIPGPFTASFLLLRIYQ